MNLTKEQKAIVNDLIYSEYIKMCQLLSESMKNKYLDVIQIETQIDKLKELMNIFSED